jgi:hypothetical protein
MKKTMSEAEKAIDDLVGVVDKEKTVDTTPLIKHVYHSLVSRLYGSSKAL